MNTLIKKEGIKLNHIDQLRGVAILMVIMVHVYQSQVSLHGTSILIWNFGVVGVQLFFVLSAYTLCMSMTARKEESSLSKFYLRRFFRIAPLYYVGILIYYLITMMPSINLGGKLSHSEHYTVFNIISNVFFIHGLIPGANNTIVPGGWSIGTEMLFYLIFPGLFLIYQRIANVRTIILMPITLLVAANIFQILLHHHIGDEVYTNVFYYNTIINQLPVFSVGMTYYFLDSRKKINFGKNTSLAGFILFFLLAFVLMFKWKTNISIAIFTVSISFCFLFRLFQELSLSLRLLSRIGQLSYSIYLFHFLFAYPLVSKVVMLCSGSINPYLLYAFSFLLTICLSMGIATLSEKLIEAPGIRLGRYVISKTIPANQSNS